MDEKLANYIQSNALAFLEAGAKRLPHIADTMANYKRGVTPEEAVRNAKADATRWADLTR